MIFGAFQPRTTTDLLSSQPLSGADWKRHPPLCHPERSRGICSSADLSWECVSTERSGPAVLSISQRMHIEPPPYPLSSRVEDGPKAACGPPKEMKTPSLRQPLSMEASPSPLSSREFVTFLLD